LEGEAPAEPSSDPRKKRLGSSLALRNTDSQFSIFSKLPANIRTLAAHFYNPANNMER
jgi:hypothetical protein